MGRGECGLALLEVLALGLDRGSALGKVRDLLTEPFFRLLQVRGVRLERRLLRS